jgi:hypothetical protein
VKNVFFGDFEVFWRKMGFLMVKKGILLVKWGFSEKWGF